MGLLDKILGTDGRASATPGSQAQNERGTGPGQDEVAVERYRYMLRTAPPATVEQAHAEAFAKLTPEQRRQVLAELSASTPEAERGTADDPQSLARTATRAEMREPGTMERTLGGGRGGMGMGGVVAGSLLASVAGSFIGTSIAGAFLDDDMGGGAEAAAGEDVSGGGPDPGDAGGDPAGDPGMDDGGLGGDFEV